MASVLIYPNSQSDDGYTIDGFVDFETAKKFVIRNVRDSLEEFRTVDTSPEQLRQAWFAFGDNAVAIDGEKKFSVPEDMLQTFLAQKATSKQRDWQSLKP